MSELSVLEEEKCWAAAMCSAKMPCAKGLYDLVGKAISFLVLLCAHLFPLCLSWIHAICLGEERQHITSFRTQMTVYDTEADMSWKLLAQATRGW